MKHKNIISLGFISVALSAGLIFSSNLFAKETVSGAEKKEHTEASRLEALAKFTKVLSIVQQYDVDDITIEELIDKALDGMMKNLDAHSNYLTQKDYKRLQVQTDGEFGGLGITVGMKDGALTVISPIDGTPADKAGLKAGDIILKIDDKSTIGMTIDEAVSLMRGKVNTPIDLTIVREGEIKPLQIHIVRGVITIESVHTKMINDDILYIRVASFDKKVAEDVAKAIKKKKAVTKGIILDLRNNPGGLLDQAVGFAVAFYNDFVKPNKIYREASEVEREAILDLRDKLANYNGDLDAESLQSVVFSCGRERFDPLRKWFQALYEILLGASQGPRFGGFIALYGIEETIALIDSALEGKFL
jgi:carboxyl-terminal processing protease